MLDQIKNNISILENSCQTDVENNIVKLFKESVRAAEEGNYPVAAALINKENRIVSIGSNQYLYPKPNSGAHAEIITLNDFEDNSRGLISEHSLLVTLEPCLMCASRIVLSGVKKIDYLLADPAGGGVAIMNNAPDDFRNLAERMTFRKLETRPKIVEIASRLYELGEEIWRKHYSL